MNKELLSIIQYIVDQTPEDQDPLWKLSDLEELRKIREQLKLLFQIRDNCQQYQLNARTEIDEDEQLLINLGSSTNNDQEEREPNEEGGLTEEEEEVPINVYNDENFRQFLDHINIEFEDNNLLENHNKENNDEKMATFLVKPSKFTGAPNEDP
ncbi:hypothetical protein Glove_117g3 [Diversispora epigaea]|uniref:Uncharacterized protein n=1 Tax=Diversispora epigaea TaxID=1348612 RepID=A0A397J9S8_9GLOM|nr:hypothetical protein Glove_117g3 [Diversispora epigaea]